MLVYMPSFKSFEVTGVNQELSMLTHVMKNCAIMQTSSTSDPNTAKAGATFFFKTVFTTVHSHTRSNKIDNNIFGIWFFFIFFFKFT